VFEKSLFPAIFTLLCLSVSAEAQVAISANDGKIVLHDGILEVRTAPLPDTAEIFDLSGPKARNIGEVQVPVSVAGPPQSVAIAPGGRIAVVASAARIDTQDLGKLVPDDRISVIDLKTQEVVQHLHAGLGASSVAINQAGTLALVTNRNEDTLSVFTISGDQLTATGDLYFDKGAQPSAVAFTPDGSKALITREGDNRISLITINGTKVIDPNYAIYAGLRPFAITMGPFGRDAFVTNIGLGGRDNDSVSVIDMLSDPVRVVNTVSVAPSPAGVAISPDGRYLAVSSLNGSHLEPGSSGYHKNGLLQVFARTGHTLRLVAKTNTGHGCEGVAWASGHAKLMLQCHQEKTLSVYAFSGSHLYLRQTIGQDSGPASLAVEPAEKHHAQVRHRRRRR